MQVTDPSVAVLRLHEDFAAAVLLEDVLGNVKVPETVTPTRGFDVLLSISLTCARAKSLEGLPKVTLDVIKDEMAPSGMVPPSSDMLSTMRVMNCDVSLLSSTVPGAKLTRLSSSTRTKRVVADVSVPRSCSSLRRYCVVRNNDCHGPMLFVAQENVKNLSAVSTFCTPGTKTFCELSSAIWAHLITSTWLSFVGDMTHTWDRESYVSPGEIDSLNTCTVVLLSDKEDRTKSLNDPDVTTPEPDISFEG